MIGETSSNSSEEEPVFPLIPERFEISTGSSDDEATSINQVSKKVEKRIGAFAEQHGLDDKVAKRLQDTTDEVAGTVLDTRLGDRVRNKNGYVTRVLQGAERYFKESREASCNREDVEKCENTEEGADPSRQNPESAIAPNPSEKYVQSYPEQDQIEEGDDDEGNQHLTAEGSAAAAAAAVSEAAADKAAEYEIREEADDQNDENLHPGEESDGHPEEDEEEPYYDYVDDCGYGYNSEDVDEDGNLWY